MILGLLIGVAIPSFSNSFASLQLNNSIRNMISLMRYGRERAIMQRKRYRIEFDIEEKKYWLSREEDPINAPDEFVQLRRTIENRRLPENISIRKVVFPGEIIKFSHPYISFCPDGSVDSAEIYLINKKEESCVIFTKTFGKIEGSCGRPNAEE